MKEIRFTIGDSNVWYSIRLDFELTKCTTKDVHALSYFIKQAQKDYKEGVAKKVEIYDEDGNKLAKTPDIMDFKKWEYIDNQ